MTNRLDTELARRDLARSRTHAGQLIAAGLVSVNGVETQKASHQVKETDELTVAMHSHYVSRAAEKLLAALDEFNISVTSRIALDLGASTGGFTQVLRERGAAPVIAVDVGHDQLAPEVAADANVISVEGCNVRYLTREQLASLSGIADPPQVITADLSFISLRYVLPAIAEIGESETDIVLLIKPQYEVGRTGVKSGIVSDPGARADAVSQVLWSAWDSGIQVCGVMQSPILGGHGNREYLAHVSAQRGASPAEYKDVLDKIAKGTL